MGWLRGTQEDSEVLREREYARDAGRAASVIRFRLRPSTEGTEGEGEGG